MNLRRRCVLLIAAFLCTGCMTGAALVQTPQALKLNAEPPRHYELSLDVRIADKPYHVDYSWSCEQQRVFTPSSMEWVLRWKSSGFKMVAKQIDDGAALFFWQPSAAHCVPDTADFTPRLLLTNGERQPVSATFFDARYDAKESRVLSRVVVQGVVRRVQVPSALGKMTPKEEDLAISMTSRLDHYMSRNVGVAGEEAWKINRDLEEMFLKLTKTTRAMDLLHEKYRRSGIFQFVAVKSFPKGWKSPGPIRYYASILHEGRLVPDAQPLQARSEVFRFEPDGENASTIEFCHLGQCLQLEGALNEVYYPASRELVSVSRRNLKGLFHN